MMVPLDAADVSFFSAGLPVIRKMPPISAVAGEPLVVTCPAAGFPIHAVTWEKGKNA